MPAIAGLANTHPALHELYEDTLTKLTNADPSLERNFANSVFAGAHFNLGPEAFTRRHNDFLNLVEGSCAVTNIGPNDPDKGGHLILWDLRLVIRFPPGSTILLPSALLEHSNVPIAEGETRMSMAQYSAAGLFRWIHNGHMSDVDFASRASPKQLRAWLEARESRWAQALGRLRVWAGRTE